jgi:hypothetical protein
MRILYPLAAVALLGVFAHGASEDEIMAGHYGNTLVIKDSLGTSRLNYSKDHTFFASSWLGDVSGHWKIEDGKMCLYAEKYPFLYRLKYKIPECDEIVPRKVGDQWEAHGRHYTLVEGTNKE